MFNISSIPQTSMIGRVARKALGLLPPGTHVPVLQGRLRGRKWIVGSGEHGCWLGSYEAAKQRAFADLGSGKKVIFDIGAHVGFYSMLAAVLVGEKGKVFAFEPLPRNLDYLRRHLAINRIHTVSVCELAISDSAGTARFDEAISTGMGKLSTTGQLAVQMDTLDHLYETKVLPDPDMMKIDVEGAEALVLVGARQMLERAHPIIFLATHGEDADRKCRDFLQSLGYTLGNIGPDGTALPNDELIAVYRATR